MTIVKICGLTQVSDVERALEYGADWLGFIHVAKSPRHVPLERLADLLEAGKDVTRVVVVRNAPQDELARIRETFSFEYFQFHGDEPADYLDTYQGYRVFHMDGDATQQVAPQTFGTPFLLDTAVRGQRGGTGKTFNWEILPQVKGQFLVAGGLTPENVGSLVAEYRPWGVDVSSGVEATPGTKDHLKLKRFIENVRREDS